MAHGSVEGTAGAARENSQLFLETFMGHFLALRRVSGGWDGWGGVGAGRRVRQERSIPTSLPVRSHLASPNASPEGEIRLCPSVAPPWLRRSSLVGREALRVHLTSHNTSGTVVPARFEPRGRRWEGPGASWSPAAAATLGNLAYGPRGLLLGRGPGYVL